MARELVVHPALLTGHLLPPALETLAVQILGVERRLVPVATRRPYAYQKEST